MNDTPQEPISIAGPAIEWASLCDRRYFEQHPGERERVRLAISGEFGPLDVECTHVRVVQLAPGVRTREPLTLYMVTPDGALEALDDLGE